MRILTIDARIYPKEMGWKALYHRFFLGQVSPAPTRSWVAGISIISDSDPIFKIYDSYIYFNM